MSATAVTGSAIKDTIQVAIVERGGEFVRLAHDIHAHPGLAFGEEYAARRITGALADEGFVVREGVFGLPMAFIASVGSGPVHIALCAAYDALGDGIGHGCGHNLIAGAAVAAAIGLYGVVDEAGLTVSVIAAPSEELIGIEEPRTGHLVEGKIALVEAGALDDVHAALMVHPGATPYSGFIPSAAGQRIRARFSQAAAGGRALGPAEAQGLSNALRRALIPLREPPYFCGVEPERKGLGAKVDLLMAALSRTELKVGRDRAHRCLQMAASAAGVAVEILEDAPVAELRNDPILAAAYRKNAEALERGRELDGNIQDEIRRLMNAHLKSILKDPRDFWQMLEFATHPPRGLFLDQAPLELYGSDLGNVSHVIPSIHPIIGIGGTAPNNTAAFTAQADTDEAYRAMLDGGVALAWTSVDAATDAAVRSYLLERARLRWSS